MDIPYELMFIVYVSTITISFHRIHYIVLYVLKKRRADCNIIHARIRNINISIFIDTIFHSA